jgi:hypothetical protein
MADMMSDLKWVFFDLGPTPIEETEAHRTRLAATSKLAGFGLQCSVATRMRMCERGAVDFAPSV